MKNILTDIHGWQKILLVVLILVLTHLIVRLIRHLGEKLTTRYVSSSMAKLKTVLSLIMSFLIFGLYFAGIGFVLTEMGISLKAYLASASILGLAIGFGSQGFVQDVVIGLTLVFSDLVDIGDMVEISGQIGFVNRIGLRFTVLVNSFGAEVFIPNRTIGNVVSYPSGYIRCLVDVTIPSDKDLSNRMEKTVDSVSHSIYEQFPGIVLTAPSNEGKQKTKSIREFMRVKFRLWPGRGDIIEKSFKPEILSIFKKIDPSYEDWMIAVNFEVEKKPVSLPYRKKK